MKKLLLSLALVIAATQLGGCALLAAGVIGGVVVANHDEWCRWHPYDCRYYRYHR